MGPCTQHRRKGTHETSPTFPELKAIPNFVSHTLSISRHNPGVNSEEWVTDETRVFPDAFVSMTVSFRVLQCNCKHAYSWKIRCDHYPLQEHGLT